MDQRWEEGLEPEVGQGLIVVQARLHRGSAAMAAQEREAPKDTRIPVELGVQELGGEVPEREREQGPGEQAAVGLARKEQAQFVQKEGQS
eukprot:14524091-Alexandrium_andersonii.AAC.1